MEMLGPDLLGDRANLLAQDFLLVPKSLNVVPRLHGIEKATSVVEEIDRLVLGVLIFV